MVSVLFESVESSSQCEFCEWRLWVEVGIINTERDFSFLQGCRECEGLQVWIRLRSPFYDAIPEILKLNEIKSCQRYDFKEYLSVGDPKPFCRLHFVLNAESFLIHKETVDLSIRSWLWSTQLDSWKLKNWKLPYIHLKGTFILSQQEQRQGSQCKLIRRTVTRNWYTNIATLSSTNRGHSRLLNLIVPDSWK